MDKGGGGSWKLGNFHGRLMCIISYNNLIGAASFICDWKIHVTTSANTSFPKQITLLHFCSVSWKALVFLDLMMFLLPLYLDQYETIIHLHWTATKVTWHLAKSLTFKKGYVKSRSKYHNETFWVLFKGQYTYNL